MSRRHGFRRRALLATPLAIAAGRLPVATARQQASLTISAQPTVDAPRFSPECVSTVGVYDADWLLTPPFERMLDLMAGSPGAISGVRFFGIFSSGTPELLQPESGGTVWTDPDLAPDFAIPFNALEALTSRGLMPFIALGFFPPAVSERPIVPPPTFDRWQQLVIQFLTGLAGDSRFGVDAMATWRFEVWNEPNEGRFWSGTFDDYLELYRATDQAVRESGFSIRLGGPAMAYKPESEPEDGPQTLRRFLSFLHDHPDIQCDFVSYHRKGTVDRSAPDPGRLWNAAREVERLVNELVPERASAIELINNEADEKIGFESPFPPRMDYFAASWFSTLVSVNAQLTSHLAGAPPSQHRFYPDNANLQLLQAPFDGRRSIFVPVASDDRTRLVKTSGAAWYDLLPLLEGTLLSTESPVSVIFPDGDIHLLATRTASSCTLLFTWFPTGEQSANGSPLSDVLWTDLPWDQVNVIEYRFDLEHSNSYAAAQGLGALNGDALDDEIVTQIRQAQELSYTAPLSTPVVTERGMIRHPVRIQPFTTICFWITPHDPSPVDPPSNLRLRTMESEIDVLWDTVDHPQLLGYEVQRIGENGETVPLMRLPIRPAMVTDHRWPGSSTYRVRSVTCSRSVSDWVSVTHAG